MLVEIISIGNELLMGRTVNTNAAWLADRVTRLGGVVRRVTVVGDDVDEIASSIREAASRRAELIVTTGGLGTTPDDKTMEGLAKALGAELELNGEAFEMLKEKVGGRAEEPHVKKMAYLPRGAKPLSNPIGAAPGALTQLGSITVVALPGVPMEMKALFELHVEPLIKGRAPRAFYEVEATLEEVYEADLAPVIEEALRRHPQVYVKTHPRLEGGRSIVQVHVARRGASANEVKAEVEEVLSWLIVQAKARGAKLTRSEKARLP
ncbi:MAG: molybdopterin-binding protein [Candidatus Nezhaarchaeota archaeon]|nr:molybdopterin-binding protein [Candidatus Nezhaarchaeota archaeon]